MSWAWYVKLFLRLQTVLFFQGDDEDFLVDNEENLEPEVKPEPETVSKASKEYLGKLQYKVS